MADYTSAINQVAGVNYGADYGLASGTNSLANSDPTLFPLMLEQQMNSLMMGIFGNSEDDSNDIFDSIESFMSPTAGLSNTGTTTDPFSGLSSATPSYVEFIARANLIDKTVSAIDPTTQQQISGIVKSVQRNIEAGGTVTLTIEKSDGQRVDVPPELLISTQS